MPALDFRNYGIRPNDEKLLRRIYVALSEFRTFGMLELQSAWLYYGSLSAASAALKIPLLTYRKSVSSHRLPSIKAIRMTSDLGQRWKSMRTLEYLDGQPHLYKATIPLNDRDMILDGANMIRELPDTERKALFNRRGRVRESKESYIAKVTTWRRDRGEKPLRPVTSSGGLLKAYLRMWHLRPYPRMFFQCSGVNRPLQDALKYRNEIENLAHVSNLCLQTLDIFREYDRYCLQWSETRKHIRVQRKLLDSNRKKFRAQLEVRDGSRCAKCLSEHELRIDHIRPVSDGGFSELKNLQLLCNACNTKKGRSEEDYRSRRLNDLSDAFTAS